MSTFKHKILKLKQLYANPRSKFDILYESISNKLDNDLYRYERNLDRTFDYLINRSSYKVLKVKDIEEDKLDI